MSFWDYFDVPILTSKLFIDEWLEKHGRRVHALGVTFFTKDFSISGVHRMQTQTFKFDQQITGVVGGLDASGAAAAGTISAVVASSSDATIFTVAADPSNPLGIILKGVKPGTAQLNLSGTATEPASAGGAVHTVTGQVSIVITPDTPAVASLGVTFGTPGPIAPPTGTP